ncbi:MAG: glycosyltransferase [Methylorubrum populi]
MDAVGNQGVESRDRAVRLAWQAEVVSIAVQHLGIDLLERDGSHHDREDLHVWLSRTFDRSLIAASGLFDPDFYLSVNADVAQAKVDPLEHYLQYGAAEGRRPSAAFDGALYVSAHADLRQSDLNPLVHYLKYGLGEGRLAGVPRILPTPVRAAAGSGTVGGLFHLPVHRPEQSPYVAVLEQHLALETQAQAREVEAEGLRAQIRLRDEETRAQAEELAAARSAAQGRKTEGQAAVQVAVIPPDPPLSDPEPDALLPGLPVRIDKDAPRPPRRADLDGEFCLVKAFGSSQIFLLSGRYPSVVRYPMPPPDGIRDLGFESDAVSEIPAPFLDTIPFGAPRLKARGEPHIVLICSAFAFGRAGQTIVLDALAGGSSRTTLVSLREGPGLAAFEGRFEGPIVLPETEPFYAQHGPKDWAANSIDGNAGLMNRFGGMLRSLEARVEVLTERLRDSNVSAVVACSGDHPDLPLGAALARRLGVPFCAYLFDDPVFQWQDGRFDSPHARLMERQWITEASAILTPNEELGRTVRIRNEDLEIRYPLIVRNPIGHNISIQSEARPPKAVGEPWIIAYTGSVYHAQADAFRNLLEVLEQIDEPWEIHIASEQDAERIRREGIGSPAIRLLGSLTREEAVSLQRRADVLFLPLAFEAIPDVIRTSAPLKTGEYLASGRPILVHAPQDAWLSRFFRERGCGVVVDQPKTEPLKAALSRLRHDQNLRQELLRAQVKSAQEFRLDMAQRAFRAAIANVVAEGIR